MPPHVSLFCLPCAGASATMYLRWRRLLPHWITLVPLELPGRGARLGEVLLEDFNALVAVLYAEHGAEMQGRFALFGHSMGALLAWGLTQRLHADGRPLPQALLVSGSAAPSQRDPKRFVDLDDDAALLADLRKQGGTPEEFFASPDLVRMTLETLAADYRVCQSFVHAGVAPLSLPLHVFAGRQDDIEPWRMEAWSGETHSDDFTLNWFAGGHFFIRQQEQPVLAALTQRLAHSVNGGVYAPRSLA